jgi:RNA polymerase sigma-70 factor, ECF subfamily
MGGKREGHVSQPDASSISTTLLEQIRVRQPEAWERLVDLYGPVVFHWCRQSGLTTSDAADVVQEVWMAVARNVAGFRREQPGDSFRGWLWTITRNERGCELPSIP